MQRKESNLDPGVLEAVLNSHSLSVNRKCTQIKGAEKYLLSVFRYLAVPGVASSSSHSLLSDVTQHFNSQLLMLIILNLKE